MGDALADDGTRNGFNFAALGTVTERNLDIVDVLKEVAGELGCTPPQAGLARLLRNPDVTAPIIGARTPAQLEDNLAALTVDVTVAQLDRLDEVSTIDPGQPHALLTGDHIQPHALLTGDHIQPHALLTGDHIENVMRGGMKIQTSR